MTERPPIDPSLIEPAAQWAVDQLRVNRQALVCFTTGDGTGYRVNIAMPERQFDFDGAPRENRAIWVSVLNSFGLSYEWSGLKVGADYCTVKWCRDGNEWTGRAVAALLNAMAAQPGWVEFVRLWAHRETQVQS